MKYIEYPLFAEGYINRYLTTGIFTRNEQFEKATLSGSVNEWLKYGFSIHENPCRKEFIAKRKEKLPEYKDLSSLPYGTELEVFGRKNLLHMYVPFGNIGMESSGFYYTPTYLRSYSYVAVKAEKTECVVFELATCGGMTLWVNGKLVTDFVPFTRNLVKSATVSVELQAGINDFVICLDDLAERDTDYYFRLRRLGDSRLTICLPVADEVDTVRLQKLESMLDQMYFEKEVYISETVNLQITNLCWAALDAELTIIPGEFIEKMEHQEVLLTHKTYRILPGQGSLELFHSDEIRPGYYYFSLKFQCCGIELQRKIGNQLVRKEFLNPAPRDLAERKRLMAGTILQYGVDNIYKAALLLRQGEDLERAESMILGELPGVRARKDCSDFHFIIALYCYRAFSSCLSDRLKQELEETMLGYRYWIDEPGDDVMWFFSENHALLFHICQYLAGSYLPDRVFANSSLTGKQLRRKAERLLEQWFDGFFKEFITEWNSNAYIPVDVLGIGTLYNLTDAGHPFHNKAKKALDMIFYSLCINEHRGAVMTSFGRTYEKEMKGNYNVGTTSMLYIAYESGCINRASIGCVSLILGDYEAPEEYSKYLNLEPGQALIHKNTQGFENHVNLYLYKTADVLLSAAVGFKPFEYGYQEHIMQAAIDKSAQLFINHPGESQPYGSGRPNFWAGNGVLPMVMQYHGTGILYYRIPEMHRIDYTHAYVPLSEFRQYQGDSHTIALEKDGGFIGVRTLNRLELQQNGPCRHREFISRGRTNVWVVVVAGSEEYKSLDEFLADLELVSIELLPEGGVKVCRGDNMQCRIDGENQCFVNEKGIYRYPISVEGEIEMIETGRGITW